MRSRVSCFAVVWLSFVATALADEEVTIVRDGKSDYVIVVPDKATPVEQTAARELQQHLAAVTGVTLPVVSEAEAPRDMPRVSVGDGAATRKLLAGLSLGSLAPDTIVIRTAGRDLVLAGHPRRGTLYAVYVPPRRLGRLRNLQCPSYVRGLLGQRAWNQVESQVLRPAAKVFHHALAVFLFVVVEQVVADHDVRRTLEANLPVRHVGWPFRAVPVGPEGPTYG